MKQEYYLFLFAFWGLCGVYAQEGRVGINTDAPEKTLDVNGELRIRTTKENTDAATNRILMEDKEGVVKIVNPGNFGAMGTTKVSAVGIDARTDRVTLRNWTTC